MTVYNPGEVNIQELLQKQHEKYGEKIARDQKRLEAYKKAKELNLRGKKMSRMLDRLTK